jgi:hypothetical protein
VVLRWGLLAGWRFALGSSSPYVFQIIGGDLSARLLRFLYLSRDTPDVFSLKALARDCMRAGDVRLDAFVRFEQLPCGSDLVDDVVAIASFSLPDAVDDSTITFQQLIPGAQKRLALQPVRPMRLPNLGSVQMGDLIQAALEPPRRVESSQLAERLETLAAIERRAHEHLHESPPEEARGAVRASS